MDITLKCALCGRDETVKDVHADDLARHKAGELAQNVWPERSPAEREVIMNYNLGRSETHICGTCWDIVCSDEED